MKTQRFVSVGFTRAVLLLAMAAWGSTALAQSVTPASQTIIAGDQRSFVITGLNTDTNFPPVIVYLRRNIRTVWSWIRTRFNKS